MKLIFLHVVTLIISVVSLYAESYEIDERKIDLFYANGILDLAYEEELADWNNQVELYIDSTSLIDEKSIGKADVAYNTSHNAVQDLFEAFLQKSDEDRSVQITWIAFKGFVNKRCQVTLTLSRFLV